MLYQYVQLWHFTILLQQHGWYSWLFWSTVKFNFKSLTLMPIWCHTQAKPCQDEYSMNQTSLKNGRHASLEITQCHPLQDTFLAIPDFINCARGWELLSQATQKGSQAIKWLAVSIQWSRCIYAASLVQLSSWFSKTIATSDQSQFSHVVECSCACEHYLYSLDSGPETQKMALADLPLYLWGSEWGTGWDRLWWWCPPRCMAYLHQYECLSINQNGMFSILQLTSLKYRDNTMVFVVFIL